MAEYDKLEALANKATGQSWESDGGRVTAHGRGIIAECPLPQKGGVFDRTANADYIAACSPDTILALIRKHREMQEAIIYAQELIEPFMTDCDYRAEPALRCAYRRLDQALKGTDDDKQDSD